MAVMRSRKAVLWVALAALLSQNLVIPVAAAASFDEQKNYYTPDPNAHPPPAVSYTPPSHTPGGGHATPTPSHGTPSHGGGSHGGSPPANCGTPPSGGHHHHTPSPPTGGGYHNPPTHTPSPTPTTPTPTPVDPGTHTPPSGGGYYNPPTPTTPTPTPATPTTPTPTPVDPGTHTPPSGGGYYNPPTPTPATPTPTTPYTPTPTTPTPTTPYTPTPTTPIDPGTPSPPSITFPSPPFPISPPFTCIYWRNNPTLIFALFGWWGSVGSAFGLPSSTPGFGSSMNLLQALSNTRPDGIGELYREGTAALLNSMSQARFPYTTNQVQNSFVAALSSNKAATAQAQLFKLANEGKMKKPRG